MRVYRVRVRALELGKRHGHVQRGFAQQLNGRQANVRRERQDTTIAVEAVEAVGAVGAIEAVGAVGAVGAGARMPADEKNVLEHFSRFGPRAGFCGVEGPDTGHRA